jgi:hypothetical protein
MKLLIISDVHGNYEALLAVAHAEEADEVWCLGDLVDFGAQAGRSPRTPDQAAICTDSTSRQKLPMPSLREPLKELKLISFSVVTLTCQWFERSAVRRLPIPAASACRSMETRGRAMPFGTMAKSCCAARNMPWRSRAKSDRKRGARRGRRADR